MQLLLVLFSKYFSFIIRICKPKSKVPVEVYKYVLMNQKYKILEHKKIYYQPNKS